MMPSSRPPLNTLIWASLVDARFHKGSLISIKAQARVGE
jgi:hypothetical protein